MAGQPRALRPLEDVTTTQATMTINPMIRAAVLLSVLVHLDAAANTVTMAKVSERSLSVILGRWMVLKGRVIHGSFWSPRTIFRVRTEWPRWLIVVVDCRWCL